MTISWTIRLRDDAIPADRVEARGLVERLRSSREISEAEAIDLEVGRFRIPLRAFARIDRQDVSDSASTIRLIGDFERWDGIGFGMSGGRLIVEGGTGARTAAQLGGGTVEVQGKCGPWAGAAMAGGTLVIQGDAGDWLGANWPGEIRGMTGGEIYVHGRAGAHSGVRMRRGMIAVAGVVDEGAGRAMIAGSILLAAGCRGMVGLGMKRGTVVLGPDGDGKSAVSASGFPEADPFGPLTLGIQLRHAEAAGWSLATRMARAGVIARYRGDRLVQGLGEVIVLADSEPEGGLMT